MRHSCSLVLVLVFIISVFNLNAQDSVSDLKDDVFSLMKHNTTSKNKKKAKKFFRILNSKQFSSELSFQIKLVLLDFQNRQLGFHSHYVSFFEIVIECEKNLESKLLLKDALNFLISKSYSISNLELKHFLSRFKDVLKSQVLSNQSEFLWKGVGDFNFLIQENDLPVLYFSKVDLILCNQYDTVQLFNTKGYYDILNNVFQGDYAESSFLGEDIFLDFVLSDFSLDLNKKFFQINNVMLFAEGDINVECSGAYKNKLTQSAAYPVFISDSYDVSLEVFNNINIVSGFELKGADVFLNRSGYGIDLEIQDDSVDYIVSSGNFELKEGRLSSSNSRFVIKHNSDSIYHPLVKFSYDDYEQKIFIDRIAGSRGLNPVRNTFHGLNMFVDRLEIDLVYDNCLLFHYAPGRDIEVLFESDNYFDKTRYADLFRFDINVFGMLFKFLQHQNDSLFLDNYSQNYSIGDFSNFNNLKFNDAWDILIEFEIFGLLDCYRFGNFFKIKPWALEFMKASENKHDYDSFKIESLAAIGDTVAEIDLYLNTMDIYKVQKINLTNRFPLSLYPMSNKIKFFSDKSFIMDGNLNIGYFAFSGKDLKFDYHDFAFKFGPNSVMSFMKPDLNEISSSLIHFDRGVLFVDSVNNRSGAETLNDFPKFQLFDQSFLSYDNEPVQFLIDPFEINYLYDMSLSNLSFSGFLYIDGDPLDIPAILQFNEKHNLETSVFQDTISLYRDNLLLENASLFLNEKGLFAAGNFTSDYLNFMAKNIELSSGKMIGDVVSFTNGPLLDPVSFSGESALLHYSPYDQNFLIKSTGGQIDLYNKYRFSGDLYFDGSNLNGSGSLESDAFDIQSSHYYFSKNDIMSADANFTVYDTYKNNLVQFASRGVSLEHILSDNVFLISNNVYNVELPMINYLMDFEFIVFDVDSNYISFSNHNPFDSGGLIALKYGKKNSLSYYALTSEYNLSNNQLCVFGNIELKIKKFLLKPANDELCVSENGEFVAFKKANLLKKRWLLKDKVINNKDIVLMPSLRYSIINE